MPRMVACSYPRRANCSLAAARIASWLGGEPAGRPGRLRPFRFGVVITRGYMISTFVDISGAEGVETRAMGMRAIDEINREVPRRSKGRAVLAGTASVGFGAVAALVVAFIGLVTFGVQATVEPSHVPLAVGPSGTSAAGALAPVVSRVAAQGGDAVDWRRVGSREGAERLMDSERCYGGM